MPSRSTPSEGPVPLGDPETPPTPDLPGRVVLRPSFEDAIDAACTEIYVHATECARDFGSVHLALSAGRPQERVCTRLMVDPKFRDLPWSMAHVWIVGEGAPDPGDGGSAFADLRETLIDHSGVPETQVHPILAGDDRAGAYAAELRRELEWREPGHDRLDLALLGVEHLGWGELEGEDPLVGLGEPDFEGIHSAVRMTTRLLRATRYLALVAEGAMRTSDASRLIPDGGQLVWFLDHEAASSVEREP